MSMLIRILVAAAAMVAAPCALGQTRVMLKSAVKMETAIDSLLLSHIAEITGDGADALGAVEVAPSPLSARDRWVTVDIEQVRGALTKHGVNWGTTSLHGSECRVRLESQAPTVQSESRAREARPGKPEPQPVSFTGPSTIKMMAAARLADLYGVERGEIRIAWPVDDTGFLEEPVGGRRIDLHPLGVATSARVPLRISVFEGERMVASKLVTAESLVQREIVVVTERVARLELLSEASIAVERRWVSPGPKAPATPNQVIGRCALGHLDTGRVVNVGDVGMPLAVKRGDVVDVHCLSGTITVRMKARALSDAKVGELVQLRTEGQKQTFSARMDVPRRAVMVVGGMEAVGSSGVPRSAVEPAAVSTRSEGPR